MGGILMPLTIKTEYFNAKDENGQYIRNNTIAEQSTAEQVAEIEAAGEAVIESIPSDYTELSEDVADLKSAVNDMGVVSSDSISEQMGVVNSTGNWGSINSNYKFKALAIRPDDVIIITASARNMFVAFLTTAPNPVNGTTCNLSTAEGYNARIQVNATKTAEYTAPSDARYFWYQTMSGGNDVTPSNILINGYDVTKSLRKNITDMHTELSDDLSNFKGTFYGDIDDILVVPDKYKYYANVSSGGTYNHVGEANYYFVLIKINGGEKYTIQAPSDHTTQFGVLSSFTAPVDGETVPFSAETGFTQMITIAINAAQTGNFPSDGRYVLLPLQSGSSNYSPLRCIIDDIDYTKSVYENLRDVIGRNVNWCSMGDSIAYGTRSYMDGDTPMERNDPDLSWAHAVSVINHFNWTNIAIPGGGYLFASGSRVPGYQLARTTDYTPFNLVTIAYGVNDWKGGSPLGTVADDPTPPTTTLAAVKATIEAIMTSNPMCKIIVILPLNCRGYSFDYGDYSTNYALGYANPTNGKTLSEFVQGIKDVCGLYGIQFIDNAHESCVNRLNISSLLLDGVHPCQEAHALLGAEMARKITFK